MAAYMLIIAETWLLYHGSHLAFYIDDQDHLILFGRDLKCHASRNRPGYPSFKIPLNYFSQATMNLSIEIEIRHLLCHASHQIP